MNRLLVAVAVACTVMTVALGLWGWTARDDARADARREADARRQEREEQVGLDDDDVRAVVCVRLLAASQLDPSQIDPFATPSSDPPGEERLDPVEVGILIGALQPEVVGGIEGLDSEPVVTAMEDLRVALERTQGAELLDPASATEVLDAAARLGVALEPWC